jgi:hypothetical protein
MGYYIIIGPEDFDRLLNVMRSLSNYIVYPYFSIPGCRLKLLAVASIGEGSDAITLYALVRAEQIKMLRREGYLVVEVLKHNMPVKRVLEEAGELCRSIG